MRRSIVNDFRIIGSIPVRHFSVLSSILLLVVLVTNVLNEEFPKVEDVYTLIKLMVKLQRELETMGKLAHEE